VRKVSKRKKKRINKKGKKPKLLKEEEKSKEELFPAKILGETSSDGASIT
jgi:hypothetical protein